MMSGVKGADDDITRHCLRRPRFSRKCWADGVLAIANVFHNTGGVEIVGVVVNTPSKWGPLAVNSSFSSSTRHS